MDKNAKKKLTHKLGAKFPATTPSCSMVKIDHLDDSCLKEKVIPKSVYFLSSPVKSLY